MLRVFWRRWRTIKNNNRLTRNQHIISGETDDSVISESFGVEFLRGLNDSWKESNDLRTFKGMYDCINIVDTDYTMVSDAEINSSFDYIKCGKAVDLDGLA